MLVLAAVIAVGMLTTASLDRTTAKSVDDRASAELAVRNGFEAAKKALIASPTAATSLTLDDTFLVVRVDAPGVSITPAAPVTTASYYFLAKPQSGAANKMDYYPLFAGGAPTIGSPIDLTAAAAPPSVTRPTPPPNPSPSNAGAAAVDTDSAKTKIVKAYPAVSPWIGPPSTQWIEVHDPNDSAAAAPYTLPYQRYTFWAEDLSAYLDASVAGNTSGASSGNRRPNTTFNANDPKTYAPRYATTPAELAMFTLFDPAPTADSGTTAAKDMIGNRPLLLTVGTLKQIAPGAGNVDITSPVLATRLVADRESPMVPFGYAYKDEGAKTKPKLDINKLVQTGGDAAVQDIATKINDNLPDFGPQRKGGLSVLDYVKTIAACFIDYADSDGDATVGTDYRGYDSYPLVNELFTMKWWTGTQLKGSTYFVTIEMDTWAELWNPSNQPVSGTVSIDILENSPVQAGNYTYTFGIKSEDLTQGSRVTTTYPSGGSSVATIPINAMQPNEYSVYHLRHDVFEFNTGVSPPLIFPPPPDANGNPYKLPLSNSMASNYQLSWKDASASAVIVDKAGGGIQRLDGSLQGPNNYTLVSHKRWAGAYPASSYTDDPAFAFVKFSNPGDPRASMYLGTPASPAASPGAQAAVAYANGSSFWVRNNRPSVASTQSYAAVKPSSWPDRGHDTALVVTAPPTSPVSQAVADPPSARPNSAPTEPTKAPATISNAGSYATTAEFGNIFDPAQWDVTPDANNRWTDITSTNVANSNYGGGMSLRIGRPEFTRFDQPGLRAAQLLDLFTIGTGVNTRGLVNVNTASRDVLRALGAGVLLNRDADVATTNSDGSSTSLKDKLYPPYQAAQADAFADAVIAARPFLSAAQLSQLKTAGSSSIPLFGNSAAWTTGQPTEWNDAGTEEYFAKVFPLATTRSRNFRVFVTGQAVDKAGRVLSTTSKVFQVFLQPSRDAAGNITSQQVVTTYEAELPL